MLEFLQSFLALSLLIPDGHCYIKEPPWMWLDIASDSLIALAYLCIFISLFYLVQKRRDFPLQKILLLVVVSIASCGLSHILETWMLSPSTDWLFGCLKAWTTLSCLYSAVVIVRIIPQLLTLPTPTQSLAADSRLKAESIDDQSIQEKLHSSQQMLQLVMDNIPQFIFWKDRNSVYLGCNRNFARVAGLNNSAEIVGKTDYDLPWNQQEAEFFRECDARVMATNTPEYHIIEPQLQADGKQAWVDTNKIPLDDAQGNVVGILGTYEDITERQQAEAVLKQAKEELEIRVEERTAEIRQAIRQLESEIEERKQTEEALRQSEEALRTTNHMLQTLIQASPIAIATINTDINVTMWNPAAERLFGWSESEVLGNPLPTIPADQQEEFQTQLQYELQGGVQTGLEVQRQRKDGSLIDVSLWTAPLFNDDGVVIGNIGLFVDLSDRIRAEQALRHSQQQLQSILNNSLAVIYVKNLQGQYILINRRFETLFQVDRERVQGKTDYDIFPQEIAEAFQFNDQTVLQTGTPLEIEEVAPHDDGFHTYLSIKFPLYNSLGIPYALCGISTDITERKRAEEELRQSEARFRELASREALLNRLASLIRNSLDQETILETTVLEIYYQLNIDVCVFAWYRQDTTPPGWEVIKDARNPDLPSFLGLYPLESWRPFTCKLVNQEAFLLNSVTESSRAIQPMPLPYGTAALLSLPIHTQSGELGALTCGRLLCQEAWTDEELEMLQAVANQLVIGINQAQLYEQSRLTATTAQTKATQLEVALHDLQHTQAQLIQTEKMSSLGQLVAGVAHEINNPVSFIYGNLTYINQYAQDLLNLIQLYEESYPHRAKAIQVMTQEIDLEFIKEDLPKILSSMKIGADRIREIVLSLRNFSRLDQSEMKWVDIHEGLDNTLLILAHRLKAKPGLPAIQVIKEYNNLPLVHCYVGQLNQVFMNILTNALDALEVGQEELGLLSGHPEPWRTQDSFWRFSTSENSESSWEIQDNRNASNSTLWPSSSQSRSSNSQFSIPTIWIRTEVLDPNRVRIRIADNGTGMTQEVQRRLFDPFFTTKPVGSGTGLGLSISYQIVVERHGGELLCCSAPNQGTEFSIYLPIQQ